MNIRLSQKVIKELFSLGVREFCLCAGARNSPLILCLEKAQGIRLYHFFDERSASFFAIGRMQKTSSPVAVVTTSGTAVAELLPATVEAYYSGWPLINVTADRPRHYRGSGAPQTIEQLGIFSRYVEMVQDIEHPDEYFDIQSWSRKQPLHINVCFNEPLIDEEILPLIYDASAVKKRELPLITNPSPLKTQNPLIIIGPLKQNEVPIVKDFLLKHKAPFYAEVSSGLWSYADLKPWRLQGGEKSADALLDEGLCKSVFRLGGIPTLRLWRDLEGKYKEIKVYSISDNDFSGLSRVAQHRVGWQHLNSVQIQSSENFISDVLDSDKKISDSLSELITAYPQSEVGLLNQISKSISKNLLYLGNSLPIREWDLLQVMSEAPSEVYVHRGANGIDGQVSGFLGTISEEKESWCVVGDLTALYDLSALWVVPQLKYKKLRIVVVNNKGGQIFKNIFGKEIFLNRHQIHFQYWAQMFGFSYQKWPDDGPLDLSMDRIIIELLPNELESDLFWKEYQIL